MEQYQRLCGQYPRFIYEGYDIEEDSCELRITYRFEIEGPSSLAPTWRFPRRNGDTAVWAQDGLIQDMVFSLGMVEFISYWKIACLSQAMVEAGVLNQDQVSWWKDLYYNRLGEFFYANQITEADPNTLMDIVSNVQEETSLKSAQVHGELPRDFREQTRSHRRKGVLVPIGGGKDSAVTLGLPRSAGEPLYGYVISPRGVTVHTTRLAGFEEDRIINVRRTLDPGMLELNRQGYLNDHTPFSALVAFSSILAARMYGLDWVALFNESSANESTVQGSTVNHQYSKSLKFEGDFHRYKMKYLSGSAHYFSMLHLLNEFQIAGYSAGQKQYHGILKSCNAGSRTNSWCGRCPKCLFVYLIPSPFLSFQEVREIFGKNMLEGGSMKTTLEQLIGIQEEKPFECVGSRVEINTVIAMTINRMERDGEDLPPLLSYHKGTGLCDRYKEEGDQYSSYYDGENLVPEPWLSLVKGQCVSGPVTA